MPNFFADDPVLDGLALEAYKRTRVTFDESKRSLLSSRVRRRCRALDLGSLEAYLELIRGLDDAHEEVSNFVNAITTHKTLLFRTRSVWEYLWENLSGGAGSGSSLRAWSAACSTGEEPFSVALLLQALQERGSLRSWSLIASDVSPPVVEQARNASHSLESIEQLTGLDPSIGARRSLRRREHGAYALADHLKSRIDYQQRSLFETPPGSFDLVLLRNVLIYFSQSDFDLAISSACSGLRDGGLLVIGESESLMNRYSNLNYIAPCIYRNSK